MTKFITTITLLFISIAINAQVNDSIFKEKAEKELKAEFPSFRMVNLEYTQTGKSDFSSQLFDEDFQTGTLKNIKTVNLGINLPVYKKKKLTVTTSLNYKFNEFEFSDLQNIATIPSFQQNNLITFHNFSTALSATYFSTLFKKPIIYNTSIIADGNQEGFERIKGLVGFSFILKRTDRVTMTLGAIAFVDPTAQIPFFPTFTYNYKFKNSVWDFDFIMPQRILFRRPIGNKGRISIGSMLNSNGFYVNIDNPNFPAVAEYSQLEINSGLIYEHQLSKNFIATFKGGISSFVSSRLTEKAQPNSDYFYKNEQTAKGYFNVGISFNPTPKKK
ncbi:hypothetical protein [uncultured Flavobacterium sp.]|uniref:DUF6268 family outer membrane beta-barrel protein n=1 Tax=uncultured Flavobacterium sp. TaxID=165435 RepID=UPI0030ECABCB|tara:strand:- start:533 stop:1525 length:993 start_codon:yes stop_codon:yes gene_type:complete